MTPEKRERLSRVRIVAESCFRSPADRSVLWLCDELDAAWKEIERLLGLLHVGIHGIICDDCTAQAKWEKAQGELARLREIEERYGKLREAAFRWILSPSACPRERWTREERYLADLVDPPKRPELEWGRRVKWTEEGEDQSGTIAGQMAGPEKALCAYAGKWMVQVDGDGSRFRELPDNWEPE